MLSAIAVDATMLPGTNAPRMPGSFALSSSCIEPAEVAECGCLFQRSDFPTVSSAGAQEFQAYDQPEYRESGEKQEHMLVPLDPGGAIEKPSGDGGHKNFRAEANYRNEAGRSSGERSGN